MNGKKIAIIGSGISGLTCGYQLADDHEITIFEKNSYIGGHTHTVEVENKGEQVHIDTGFIVFNDRTYPNFIKMLQETGVSFQPTEMSFSVRNDGINLEYNGNNLNTMFAQRSNLLRPRFYRFLREILLFNKEVRIEAGRDPEVSIGDYLDRRQYSSYFSKNYLLPMIAAIWSMGVAQARDFPLSFFVRFFENHGLLDVTHRPQWYTIVGGSSSYIEPITRRFHERIRLNSPIQSVQREQDGIRVTTALSSEQFDEVIFACHGDEILPIIESPTQDEKEIIGRFSCSENSVILHTDTSLLPRRKKAWASWNYRVLDDASEMTTLTYHMNILQRLSCQHNYLVSLNQEVREEHVLQHFTYHHPVYSSEALKSQDQWSRISGLHHIHYCGAYWFNGFHEDGVRSALRVCDTIRGES